MMILSIKFQSALSYDDVLRVSKERMPKFKALPGLIQKYYGREPSTGEYTGIYIWESEETLSQYRESELARTIPAAYKIQGHPRIEVFEVPILLRG